MLQLRDGEREERVKQERGEKGERERGREGEREGGREGERESGRVGERERGREGERERGREGERERGREGERERGREGERERGREGERERGREGEGERERGREGERERGREGGGGDKENTRSRVSPPQRNCSYALSFIASLLSPENSTKAVSTMAATLSDPRPTVTESATVTDPSRLSETRALSVKFVPSGSVLPGSRSMTHQRAVKMAVHRATTGTNLFPVSFRPVKSTTSPIVVEVNANR